MIIIPKLFVNEEELGVENYTLKFPEGALGGSLSVNLAKPLHGTITPESNVSFDLHIGKVIGGEVVYSTANLLNGGKVVSSNTKFAAVKSGNTWKPNDSLSFDVLNPLADRWSKSPERPIIMFDPAKIEGGELIPHADQFTEINQLLKLGGEPVFPSLEPVDNFKLFDVLDRVYTNNPARLSAAAGGLGAIVGRNLYADSIAAGTGCGFDRVITNVLNSPLERADVSITGGWNETAKSLLTLFDPLAFELGNSLVILDPTRGLPPNFLSNALSLKCTVDVNLTVEPVQLVNAAIMVYKIRVAPTEEGGVTFEGTIPSIRFENSPPSETGTGKGYVRREVLRKITDYKDINTGKVVHTEINETETKTFAYRDIIIPTGGSGRTRVEGNVRHISTEVISNRYQGQLKTGHTKTLDAVYYNPNVAGAPDTEVIRVSTEESNSFWTPDLNNPGEHILKHNETSIFGTVLVETDKQGNPVYTPIMVAAANGLIKSNGSQSTDDREIETVIEEFRETGYNQANVETTIVDHLTGAVTTPPTQSRTGSRGTYNPAGQGKAKPSGGLTGVTMQEWIKDQDSIDLYGLRNSITIDIGELDPEEGRRLVLDKLRRASNPQKFNITLPGIDLSIHRGSIINPPIRGGLLNLLFIITGLTLTGNRTRSNMVLDAIKLNENA